MTTYFALFIVATVFSLLFTPFVRRLAVRRKAFGGVGAGDEGVLVPRLGGLAVLASMLATCGVLLFIPSEVGHRFLEAWQTWALLLCSSAGLVAIAVIDDVKGSSALGRLAVQISVAGLTWWAGFRIDRVPFFDVALHNTWASLLLTCFWIVAVTNSLNLIDGLDGLASGVGFFVSITIFIVALMQGRLDEAAVAVILAGAVLGFLRFNFAPAQIYLGDTGSLLIGYLLSVLAIRSSQKATTLIAIVVPYAALGLPLLDTSLAVVRRFMRGQSLFARDSDHIHHRALARLKKPTLTTLLLYAVAALFSLGSLLIVQVSGSVVALLAVLGGISAWILAVYLKDEELPMLNEYLARSVLTHRRMRARKAQLRALHARLLNAAWPSEAWEVFSRVLDVMQIDGARCILNGADPVVLEWRRPGAGAGADSWRMTLPLGNEVARGELRIVAAIREDDSFLHYAVVLLPFLAVLEARLLTARARSTAHAAVAGVGFSATAAPRV